MDAKILAVAGFISAVTLTTSLSASTEQVEQHIRAELRKNQHTRLGDFLKHELDKSTIDLSEVRKVADEEHSNDLLRAVHATEKFKHRHKGLGLSTGAFLETALFIETDLKKYTSRHKYYLPSHKTDAPRTVEYDPHNKAVFIVLDGTKSAFLGAGAKKTAYKSIFYNHENPHVVARAQQKGNMDKELRITRQLKGARGIFSVKGWGKHSKKRQKYTALYSKLYNAGDLRAAFEEKRYFSLHEKVKIALDVLYGLEALHKHGIAHRDLGSKNFFLTISHDDEHHRKVEAVIADFGWSNYIKNIPHRKAQANFKNTAPEGFNFKKLKGSDYFGTDVFAAGLVLYQLVYEKKVPWKEGFRTGSLNLRRSELTSKIDKTTKMRREHLAGLHHAGTISKEEELEYEMLRMLNPNPKDRPTAEVLRQAVEQLYHKF